MARSAIGYRTASPIGRPTGYRTARIAYRREVKTERGKVKGDEARRTPERGTIVGLVALAVLVGERGTDKNVLNQY